MLAVSAALVAATAPAAQAAPWYWSPGWCKSMLKKYGVQLGDGRTFNVESAYCIGQGGPSTCMWSSGYGQRLYSRFLVFVRSWDGAARMFTMHPSGRTGWAGMGQTHLLGHVSSARFNEIVAPYAHQAAINAQQLGCAPPS
jgi:hypothetical protein